MTEYNCSVELQPLDFVFYNPERSKVKLVRLGNNLAEHWWIACYFQRAFMQGQLPNDDIYGYTYRARELRKEREPDYFNPRIKQEAQEQSLDSIEDSSDTAQESSVNYDSTEPGKRRRPQTEMDENQTPGRFKRSSSRG